MKQLHLSRRGFLAGGTALSALLAKPLHALAAYSGAATKRRTENIYDTLGVRTLINAKGTYTFLSGSLMPAEVTRAMQEASHHYVNLIELHQAVGAKIAKLLGVEAALVTSGAAGAIMLGTAASIAGKDPERIQQLPDLTGLKSEVIIQKSHRNPFDHAIRNVGVRLVVVETPQEMEQAFSEKTAMMYFLNAAQHHGQVGLEEFIAMGKRHGVPTFNDAAADVPPVSHLSDYNKMGFDMVAFSGGKGLCGPQCAGLLLGRQEFVDAALLNDNPHEDAIGRPCKVGKEEVIGMLVALERYLRVDHDAEWKDWERRLEAMNRIVSSVHGVETGQFVPDVANHVPHMYIRWDEAALGLTGADCLRQLREGKPSIEALENKSGIAVTPFMMKPGEEIVVARRVKAVLSAARREAAARG
jgi:uncharacterized pyridoxal phosphate-dependent enzyme